MTDKPMLSVERDSIAIDALKAARQFIANGIELGFISMPEPETPDPAHDTLPMIDRAIAELKAAQHQGEPVAFVDERAAYEEWQWRQDWPIEQLAGARRTEYFKRKLLEPERYETDWFNSGLAVWLARATRPEQPTPVALTVWYGSMPESNGKTNWTAILHRKGEAIWSGAVITIDRSEYPDRVRYEADRMRYLIGELTEEPDILDYDDKLHSGYVNPHKPAPVADHTQCEECKGWGYHENHYEGGGTECGECGGSGNATVAVAQSEFEPDAICLESDGCPTEGAVLKRFWRENQPDPVLCEFYEAEDFPSLVRELVGHVAQLQEAAKRNVKPWEDTFPPTLLPAYIARINAEQPAPVAVVMPERQIVPDNLMAGLTRKWCEGWNDALEEVARLNGVKP